MHMHQCMSARDKEQDIHEFNSPTKKVLSSASLSSKHICYENELHISSIAEALFKNCVQEWNPFSAES